MYYPQIRRVCSLACALTVLSSSLVALAQDEQSTDPTEPSTSKPIVSIPMPGEKKEEAPASNGADDDDKSDQQSLPGDPWGDVGSGGALSLRALFQFNYRSTFGAHSTNERASYAVREEWLAEEGDGFFINRLFLRVGSDPSRYVGFKAVFDFAELLDNDPEDVVKQAYATLRIIPDRIELSLGMFKIPLSILELDASSRWEFADYGPVDSLLVDSGYAGRDLGGMLTVSPLKKAKRLRISGGAWRGHAKDEHDSPCGTVGARIEAKPNKHFRFGASYVQKLKAIVYNRPFETSDKDELPDPPDPLYPAQKRWDSGRSATVDAMFKMKGFMLRGEGVYGDRVDVDTRYGAETFWAGWGLMAYKIEFTHVSFLPAVRVEWIDADREHPVGVQRQLSGAITALFLDRVRFLVDVTQTDVQAGTPMLNQPKPIQLDPYMELDNIRLSVQLQVEL